MTSAAEASDLLRHVTSAWTADPAADVVWSGEHEGRWGIRVAQQARDFTTIWFDVGDRSVRVEAFLLPAPRFRATQVYRSCLAWNRRAGPVFLAIDPRDGDIFVQGRIPLSAFDEHALEETVGAVYDMVEVTFPPLVRMAFEPPRENISPTTHPQDPVDNST